MSQKQMMKKSISIVVTIVVMVVLIVSKPIMTTFAHMNQRSIHEAMNKAAKNDISSLISNQQGLSTASNATASNGVSLLSTNLWLDISMSENLIGEGTETSPYLINSMDDLRYLAYHVANDELVDGYSGNYFELTRDLTQEYGENWLPIGYYQNNDDTKPKAFKAVFNGNGYGISNLVIDDDNQVYAGLFGYIQDAEIYNLIVEGTVSAKDKVALVVGVANNSKVEACISEGAITADGRAGGIVGEAYHSAFKNCFNTAAILGQSSKELTAYVGGIAGVLQDSIITNCTSVTALDENKLYSDDVVGGIAGYVEDSGVYNCYVGGTIGNDNTDCIGGIVGRLQSGEVRVNRIAGIVADGGQQSGLFIGDIVNSSIVLGKQISHLYVAGQERFVGNAFGNRLNSGINATHNIGAYQENEIKFAVLNQGTFYTQAFHFYMALESGVLAVNNEYLHHWAPDLDGRPMIGYLVTISSVENGMLSVKEAGNRYAYSIDVENPRAIASGRTVAVTASLNSSGSSLAEGSLKYVTRNGEIEAIIGDSFIMPEANIAVQVHYKTAVQDIELNQSALEFTIEMKRSGNRNNPRIEYKITDAQQLIAIVSPENADDKTVKWFVKDSNNQAPSDILFVEDGIVQVNLKAAEIQRLIATIEAIQAEAPDKVIYLNEKITVCITAVANDNNHKSADCEVTIDFFVTDETKNSLNDINLSHEVIEFEIVTTLTGNRLNPEILTSGNSAECYQLEVMINPESAEIDKIDWTSNQSVIAVTSEGFVYFNHQSLWVQDNINAVKNRSDADDKYLPFLDEDGNDLKYEVDAIVTVTVLDEIGTVVTRDCRVKTVHKIIDETEVFIEDIQIDSEDLDITIERRLTGSRMNPMIEYIVLSTDDVSVDTLILADNHQLLSGTLTAIIVPSLVTNQDYFWQSTNTDVIDINQDGQYVVRTDADWIKDIIIADSTDTDEERYRIKTAKGTISAEIIATTVAKGIEAQVYSATTIVNINFETVDQTKVYVEELILDNNELVFNVLGIKVGNTVTYKITDAAGNILDTEYYQTLTAIVSPLQTSLATIVLYSSNPDLILVKNDGTVAINLASQWFSKQINNQDTMISDKVIVTVVTDETDENGHQLLANVEVIINFAMTYNDQISLSGSSASSDNDFTAESFSLADWCNDRNGWRLSNKVYSNWKNINDKWYYFNFNGYLITGWQDIGGSKYYFDIPNGYMAIGWNYIDGNWFYFDSKGALIETTFQPATVVVTEGCWEALLSGWCFKDFGGKSMTAIWKLIGGAWYYLDDNGFIVTGKHDIDGKTYIFETVNGRLVYGWIQLDEVWYYAGVDGALLKNTVSPDGYDLDGDGRWIS